LRCCRTGRTTCCRWSYQRRPASSEDTSRAYRPAEAQLQLSFKLPITPPLFGDRVLPFFAYTGRSWWQVFDGDRSRPFREYNHEPELFIAWVGMRNEYFGWTNQFSALGVNHQSNGRTQDGSRSWNRVFGEFYLDRGQSQWATLKLWARIKEDAKTSPDDTSGDDNPDIERYLGHFEFKWGAVLAQNHRITATLRQRRRAARLEPPFPRLALLARDGASLRWLWRQPGRLQRARAPHRAGRDAQRLVVAQSSTAANAAAARSTLFVFKPATHMRPERTRYTACSSRKRSTCAAESPV
jgi:Phospholipase A1